MLNPDTDGDGVTDGHEVNVPGSKPLDIDTDNDGVRDDHDTAPLNSSIP
jgi:hypothetical protein